MHACFGDLDAMRYWNFPARKRPKQRDG